MEFSVVIPLHNKGPHIERAIRSALGQALPPREIVVVDDSSSDDGPARVKAMAAAEPRIVMLHRSPPGPGPSGARNMGIEHACADWVAFLDADDAWRPGHLKGLAEAIDTAGEGVGCAFARPVMVEGKKERAYPHSSRYLVPGKAHDLATMLRAWLDVVFCPMWTGAVAFRRDVLIAAGLFPTGNVRRGEDKDLWLRCMARAKTAYSPEVSAEYHQDTVNRVTGDADHIDLPYITRTIRTMLPGASGEERALLRRLANQDIGLYARYGVQRGEPFGLNYFTGIHYPEGLGVALRLAAMKLLAGPLHFWFKRRRRA